jgi:serine/threonine protein kinase
VISCESEECVVVDLSCSFTNRPCSIQRFCKEAVGWKTLRHPNVLPLLGVTMTETRFVMVSEWMVNGNINQFVKANINADRLGLVRFSFGVLIFTLY